MTAVEPPPASLYQRNATAFHLYADLLDRPRESVRVTDVMALTGVKEAAARRAVDELVALGVLTAIVRGRYRPANAPEPEPAEPLLRCHWCRKPLIPPRRKFCSDACSMAAHSKLRTARANSEPKPDLRCVVCGTPIPRRPRAGHQKYCSRHCEYVDRRNKAATAAGGSS